MKSPDYTPLWQFVAVTAAVILAVPGWAPACNCAGEGTAATRAAAVEKVVHHGCCHNAARCATGTGGVPGVHSAQGAPGAQREQPRSGPHHCPRGCPGDCASLCCQSKPVVVASVATPAGIFSMREVERLAVADVATPPSRAPDGVFHPPRG